MRRPSKVTELRVVATTPPTVENSRITDNRLKSVCKMKVVQAIAQILKNEGVQFIVGYPVNPLIETCAAEGIRPIMVRQERTGLHMCDAMSRVSCGEKLGTYTRLQVCQAASRNARSTWLD